MNNSDGFSILQLANDSAHGLPCRFVHVFVGNIFPNDYQFVCIHKAFADRHLPRYHRFSTEHTRSLGPQTGRVSAEYCERPVKYGEQHCREIGSHKRYDDKCKNESIWLAYNRADKTHFARYLKRKMTTAQFEQWSRYTVELRQKAENSEMELADYQKELRI